MEKFLPSLLFYCCCLLINAQDYQQLKHQNIARGYWVYLPQNFQPSENLPLVIQMHGFTLTGSVHMNYTQFNKIADTARCVVVYPDGISKRWNSGTFFFVSSNIDDVGFLSELIDHMKLKYNIDEERVYAGGYSAGGFMSYKLACDLTNRIAAIAPDVASMVYDNVNTCIPSRPFPIIACNGSQDPVTSYNGIPLNFPGIDSIKRFWQTKNACTTTPQIDTLPNTDTKDKSRAVRYTYTNCADNVTTTFYKILNGGHTWPDADDLFLGIIGNTNNDIQWSSYSWNFFKQNSIPVSAQCDAVVNINATIISADSFQLSWDAVAGVSSYKIGIVDTSGNVTFFTTTTTSLTIKLPDANQKYNWSVASNCNTGFRNWSTPIPLNYILTSIRNNIAQYIEVYPNPCSQYIEFKLPKSSKAVAKIIGLDGRVLIQQELEHTTNQHRIELNNLSKGIYVLSINDATQQYTSTIIKE